LGYYFDPGPSAGYSRPPSDLLFTQLGCEITYPPGFLRAKWDETIWIYGVIWREGTDVDEYAWSGPEWKVDGGRIGESFYRYDRTYPEVWVRFPFEGYVIGPGQHEITLTVWDRFGGGYLPVTDTVYIIIE
jgi:hypothetical protein